MNKILSLNPTQTIFVLATATIMSCFYLVQGIAHATSTTPTDKQQGNLVSIQNKGMDEINQRFITLNNLSTQVSSSTKLTPSDQASLSSQITTTVTSLTALKTQLATDTTVDQASTDVAGIFSNFRVYALVVPKVQLITITDNQLNIESQLSAKVQLLQAQIAANTSTAKSVSTAKILLTGMNNLVTSSQTISSTVRNDTISLQPSNWNANHNILSGDRTQLTIAYKDNAKANIEANTIANLLNK